MQLTTFSYSNCFEWLKYYGFKLNFVCKTGKILYDKWNFAWQTSKKKCFECTIYIKILLKTLDQQLWGLFIKLWLNFASWVS